MTRDHNRPSRRFAFLGLLAALSVVAVSAFAFGGPRHGGRSGEFHEFMVNRMLDRADASDEQRDQISAILRSVHEQAEDESEQGREALHAGALELLTAEVVDRDALDALRSEHQQHMDQKLDRMSDALVEAANVLSQDQRVAIAEAMREHFEERGGRHAGGHRGNF